MYSCASPGGQTHTLSSSRQHTRPTLMWQSISSMLCSATSPQPRITQLLQLPCSLQVHSEFLLPSSSQPTIPPCPRASQWQLSTVCVWCACRQQHSGCLAGHAERPLHTGGPAAGQQQLHWWVWHASFAHLCEMGQKEGVGGRGVVLACTRLSSRLSLDVNAYVQLLCLLALAKKQKLN